MFGNQPTCVMVASEKAPAFKGNEVTQMSRPCPHVVVVVGLECFNDLWGYAVKPSMGLRRARVVDVRIRGASAYQT